jgi:hypothetical protein
MRRAAATVPIRVSTPELIMAGEALPVTVHTDPDTRDAIQITIIDEHHHTVYARQPRAANGSIHTTVNALAPGGYEIRVTGVHHGSPVTPVTTHLLVWDTDPATHT